MFGRWGRRDCRAECVGDAVRYDALDQGLGPINTGLAKVAAAKTTNEVGTALAAVESSADRASRNLNAAGTPAGAETTRTELVNGLNENGLGTLKVVNNEAEEVVFSIARDGQSVASVYSAKGQQVTVEGITGGTYDFYYTSGSDWDSGAKVFTRSCRYVKFSTPKDFKVEKTSSGRTATTWTITLNPARPGNGKTEWSDVNSAPQP
ncbi:MULTISPECIES: hypothetical protein [unclassified Kitasatospora]|uniref:hypothetical protein n=1 Tax=unclassified Kitasatospora TaxID=2633591 RepID=UPI0033D33F9B